MSAVEDAEAIVRAAVAGTASAVLADLRPSLDRPFTTPEGEVVWLRQVWRPAPIVLRGFYSGFGWWHPPIVSWAYVTDCCAVASPCERHR